MKPFTLDADGRLVLDMEELLTHKPFAKLVYRDKGSIGDADGRKKYRAYKELEFIYWMVSPTSPVIKDGYGDEEAVLFCKQQVGLEDDWKIDKDIKWAMEYWADHYSQTPEVKLLNSLVRGIRLSSKICDKINSQIEKKLEELETTIDVIDIVSNDENVKVVTVQDKVFALVGLMNKVFEIANKAPETLKTLENLRKTIADQETTNGMARGKKEIHNRANPNRQRANATA